jgi:thiol:disulfide interchange protein DsbD
MKWLKIAVGVTGLVLALLSISSWALSSPAVGWQTYSDKLLLEAKKSNKPVIINFHADWCLPCIKLNQKTFNHSDFIRAAKHFTLIQVDLTERNEPKHEALIEKYKISGVPTVIFLDKGGNERKDLRVEAFLSPQDFRSRMAKLKKVKA